MLRANECIAIAGGVILSMCIMAVAAKQDAKLLANARTAAALPSLISQGIYMDDRKGLCVGGPYDGQLFAGKTQSTTEAIPGNELNTSPPVRIVARPIDTKYEEYTYEGVYVGGEIVLYFWRHDSMSLTASLHQVFAAYRKGKK